MGRALEQAGTAEVVHDVAARRLQQEAEGMGPCCGTGNAPLA
jgi:hypothetical protein